MPLDNLYAAGPLLLAKIRAGTTSADFAFVKDEDAFSSEQDIGPLMDGVGGCVVADNGAKMSSSQSDRRYIEIQSWNIIVVVPWNGAATGTSNSKMLAGPKLVKLIQLLRNKPLGPDFSGVLELNPVRPPAQYPNYDGSPFGYGAFILEFNQRITVATTNC